MKFKDLTAKNNIVTDGAMGTYYRKKSNDSNNLSEYANVYAPKIIYDIHREYIKAGANIIRTNTFSANTYSMGISLNKVLEITQKAYELAQKASGDDAVVFCDIGEIVETNDVTSSGASDIDNEYRVIVDKFLELGAENFIFASLSSISKISEIARYIKNQSSNAVIAVSFAVSQRGRTYTGKSIKQIADDIVANKNSFDIVGLNCGCGPIHIVKFISELKDSVKHYLKDNKLSFIAMPNISDDVFSDTDKSAEYFSEVLSDKKFLENIQIIGGCCGTTPKHIQALSSKLKQNSNQNPHFTKSDKEIIAKTSLTVSNSSSFNKKIENSKFVLAAELDPPYNNDISKLISSAHLLKKSGMDVITVSDSPMARARLSSVLCSANIKRTVGVDVLPHICCRDRNRNAIKSDLLAASCEGIDTVLSVTGDKIAQADKKYIKPVFDLNSISLISLIKTMNDDVFKDKPFKIGGALELEFNNEKAFLERCEKKIDCGLDFFLTQPLFSERNVDTVKKVKKLGAKVIVGILPIVSYRNALFMNNEVKGITIPDKYIGRFSTHMSKERAVDIGIGIASENMCMCRDYADGFYFITPFNRAEIICRLIDKNREIIYNANS